MEQLRTVSQSEQNYSEILRMLNTTRIEFAFLKSLNHYGQGEKCPEIWLPQKALAIVNSELELVNLKIRYPE